MSLKELGKYTIEENKIPIFCVVMIIVGLVFLRQVKYRVVDSTSSIAEKIIAIENINFENLTFLATYIVPLLCFDLDFDLTLKRNFFMLLLVLFVIGLIYIKTNIFYTNPTLALWGFNLYKIGTSEGRNIIAITRGKLKFNDAIQLKHIEDDIFFVQKAPEHARKEID